MSGEKCRTTSGDLEPPTGAASETYELSDVSEFSDMEFDSGSFKRVRAESSMKCHDKVQRTDDMLLSDQVESMLNISQRRALVRVVSRLHKDASVVITNPLLPDNPIVFVTDRWQDMCGFSYKEAIGRNPRITQGLNPDRTVIQTMSGALRNESACKVALVNYRSGLSSRPFWNMLSINPVCHSGELMLFMANLQDYSYHMSKLVHISPSQYCVAAKHFQQASSIDRYDKLSLVKPRVYDLNAPCESSACTSESELVLSLVKRLGWDKLMLDPSYLNYRVLDALTAQGLAYEISQPDVTSSDLFLIDVNMEGAAAKIAIAEDGDDTYRISCHRIAGDTFKFHHCFRELRSYLQDLSEHRLVEDL